LGFIFFGSTNSGKGKKKAGKETGVGKPPKQGLPVREARGLRTTRKKGAKGKCENKNMEGDEPISHPRGNVEASEGILDVLREGGTLALLEGGRGPAPGLGHRKSNHETVG